LRKGNTSVADFYSKEFCDYIKNPMSLLDSNSEWKEKISEEMGEK
jgi:hypothetical protein